MKSTTFLVLIFLLLPTSVYAGQIYGRVTKDNRPIGAGVRITIEECGPTSPTTTDRYGSYRIHAPRTGKCTLIVQFGNERYPTVIYSRIRPVRYDFNLAKIKGRYSLQRR